MAKIPTIRSNVAGTQLPNIASAPSASPDAFGASVGRAVGKLGEQAGQIYLKERDNAHRILLDQANTKLVDAHEITMRAKDVGYSFQKGKAANEQYDQAKKTYEELLKEADGLAAGLPAKYRASYDNSKEMGQIRFNGERNAINDRESRNWAIGTYNTGRGKLLEAIKSAASNPDSVAFLVNDLMNKSEIVGKALGWDDDKIANQQLVDRRDAWDGAIDKAITQGNLGIARGYLETDGMKTLLKTSRVEQFERRLDSKESDGFAIDFVNEMRAFYEEDSILDWDDPGLLKDIIADGYEQIRQKAIDNDWDEKQQTDVEQRWAIEVNRKTNDNIRQREAAADEILLAIQNAEPSSVADATATKSMIEDSTDPKTRAAAQTAWDHKYAPRKIVANPANITHTGLLIERVNNGEFINRKGVSGLQQLIKEAWSNKVTTTQMTRLEKAWNDQRELNDKGVPPSEIKKLARDTYGDEDWDQLGQAGQTALYDFVHQEAMKVGREVVSSTELREWVATFFRSTVGGKPVGKLIGEGEDISTAEVDFDAPPKRWIEENRAKLKLTDENAGRAYNDWLNARSDAATLALSQTEIHFAAEQSKKQELALKGMTGQKLRKEAIINSNEKVKAFRDAKRDKTPYRGPRMSPRDFMWSGVVDDIEEEFKTVNARFDSYDEYGLGPSDYDSNLKDAFDAGKIFVGPVMDAWLRDHGVRNLQDFEDKGWENQSLEIRPQWGEAVKLYLKDRATRVPEASNEFAGDDEIVNAALPTITRGTIRREEEANRNALLSRDDRE